MIPPHKHVSGSCAVLGERYYPVLMTTSSGMLVATPAWSPFSATTPPSPPYSTNYPNFPVKNIHLLRSAQFPSVKNLDCLILGVIKNFDHKWFFIQQIRSNKANFTKINNFRVCDFSLKVFYLNNLSFYYQKIVFLISIPKTMIAVFKYFITINSHKIRIFAHYFVLYPML